MAAMVLTMLFIGVNEPGSFRRTKSAQAMVKQVSPQPSNEADAASVLAILRLCKLAG